MTRTAAWTVPLFSALLAGCGAPWGAAMPSAGGALAAAGGPARHALSLDLQYGDHLAVETGWFQGVWGGGDDMVSAELAYHRYDTGLGATGWRELDAFRERAGGWGASFRYTKGVWWSGDEYVLKGTYTGRVGDAGLVDLGLGYGLCPDGSTLNLLVCDLGLKYYLLDGRFRLGTGWHYNDYWDSAGSSTYHTYFFGAEYLLGEDSPLLLSFRYEREQQNNSPASGENYVFGARWFATGALSIGAGVELARGLPSTANRYVVRGAWRPSPGTTVSLGYSHYAFIGGNWYDAFSAGCEWLF